MFGTQMFAGPKKKQWDTEDFDQQALLGSSMCVTPSSLYYVVIYGGNSLPGAGPPFKFFSGT